MIIIIFVNLSTYCKYIYIFFLYYKLVLSCETIVDCISKLRRTEFTNSDEFFFPFFFSLRIIIIIFLKSYNLLKQSFSSDVVINYKEGIL